MFRSRPYPALFAALAAGAALLGASAFADDLVFIHHSCGQNWLDDGLEAALAAKIYIDERNDIYYGTDFAPTTGRPDSLAGVPGDNTNMNHWIRWFNDYFDPIRSHGCADGFNRIVMFKSCYPISDIESAGTAPGDPFSSSQTIANYQAAYRKYGDPGGTYANGGYVYRPLEDVFAAHPDILFIPVTAPPRHYAPSDPTTDAAAHRARVFNDWLAGEWLASYRSAHPGLDNVAVFDWFDFLAYPDDDPSHPNRLRAEYGGTGGDSHPTAAANAASAVAFASGADNFLDAAFAAFASGTPTPAPSPSASRPPSPSPSPSAVPPWSWTGGVGIGSGLGTGYEPSGLSWNEETALLFVVGDGGQVSWMSSSGVAVVTRTPGGDLEGVAIADPSSPFVYLGVENPDSIVEYNYQSRSLSGKSWTLTSWMSGDANQGLEALAFVPNGYHPYAASSSGGLFYAGLQQDGKIYVFDVNLGTSGTVSHVATLTPYPGLTDISGLDFRPETGILYAIFDSSDLLLEMDPDGTIWSAQTLPAGTQEGIAFRPDCAARTATVFIAHDDPGAVVRYQGYPIACLISPSPTPTPRRTPTPAPTLPRTPTPKPTLRRTPTPPRTPTPAPTLPRTPTPAPSLSPPPSSARALFVHDSRAAWLGQTRSENGCGIFYSPYSDENGALCDHDHYGREQVRPEWFGQPAEYRDRNFFLYVHRAADEGWNTVAGDRIRIWYQETAGGEERSAWLYLPGGAALSARCDVDEVTLVYYDVDGNAYWDAALAQPAYLNLLPTPPPTPPPSPSPAAPPSPTPGRIVSGSADYDGDGADDLALFRPSDGGWRVRETTAVFYGTAGDIPVPGDYDADGLCDIAVFRPSEAKWWLRNPAGGSLWRAVFGRAGDIPVPADYDGDFATDTALFRPSTGQWFVRSVSSFSFGQRGDAPAPGDYDGDGRAEAAVWRPNGWYVRGITQAVIGIAGDVPVPGDYDGDGTCEIALFRPSCGLWQIRGATSFSFGLSGDIPFPLDYDGDGTAGAGLYRPSEGRWHLHLLTAIYYGIAADQPLAGGEE